MGAAAKPRCAVVFLMFLSLGLSLSFPAEDVLDAIYDESEAVPYEETPVFSIDAPLSSARIAKAQLNRNVLPHFDSMMKRCKSCRENSARPLSVPNSLSIINEPVPLRC